MSCVVLVFILALARLRGWGPNNRRAATPKPRKDGGSQGAKPDEAHPSSWSGASKAVLRSEWVGRMCQGRFFCSTELSCNVPVQMDLVFEPAQRWQAWPARLCGLRARACVEDSDLSPCDFAGKAACWAIQEACSG